MTQTMQPLDAPNRVFDYHPHRRNRLVDQLLDRTQLSFARLFGGLAHHDTLRRVALIARILAQNQPSRQRQGLGLGQSLVMDLTFVGPTATADRSENARIPYRHTRPDSCWYGYGLSPNTLQPEPIGHSNGEPPAR